MGVDFTSKRLTHSQGLAQSYLWIVIDLVISCILVPFNKWFDTLSGHSSMGKMIGRPPFWQFHYEEVPKNTYLNILKYVYTLIKLLIHSFGS